MSTPSRSKGAGGGSSRHQSSRSYGGPRHNNNSSFHPDDNRHPLTSKNSNHNTLPYSNEGPPSLKRPRVDLPPNRRIIGHTGPTRHNYGYTSSRSRSPPPPRHSSSHYYPGPLMNSSPSSYNSHHGNERRPERDTRSSSSFSRGQNGHRGGSTVNGEKGSLNASTNMTKQRIYSDFRIARVKIGSFEVIEDNSTFSSHSYNSHNGLKDSRLRLYFRGSGSDKQYATNYVLSENSSARDRALTEPDRLSISIYNGTKRIVIPVQDGLEKVQFRRSDGYFRIQSKSWALFEELDFSSHHGSRGGNSRHSSSIGHFRKCDDITKGQLEAADGLIEVWTDLDHPLPLEPKWVHGNLTDYIDARSKFLQQKVLEVLDPELIIDFDSLVSLWIKQSAIATMEERKDFAKNKLPQLSHILELCSKMLAPPHYYVSKALVASSSGRNSSHSSSTAAKLEPSEAASALESGQIPALISPSVNALLASFTYIAKNNANLSDAELISMLKTIMYQVPEPVLWRALDGIFSKRGESELSFNAEAVMKKLPEKTNQKAAQIKEARLSTESIGNAKNSDKPNNNNNKSGDKDSTQKIDDDSIIAKKENSLAPNDSKKKSDEADDEIDEDEIMDNADEYTYNEES